MSHRVPSDFRFAQISKYLTVRTGWRDLRRATLTTLSLLVLIGCASQDTVVIVDTSAGQIVVELYPDAAPLTVANFLAYVDSGRYEGGTFYRVVRDDNQAQNTVLIDVIQGGLGFDNPAESLPAVLHESTAMTGLQHLDGTVSLARAEPGTGSSEFFVCVGEQPSLDHGGLRNPDGLGFAAFGRTLQGMHVVRQIQAMPTIQPQGALEYTSGQMITEPVIIHSIRRR